MKKPGVEEYWIVPPSGTVENCYQTDGKYVLEQGYMLENHKEENYNADTKIALKAFPNIRME